MQKILKDFYFGNIIPAERQTTPSSELQRAAESVSRCERQLREQLNEAERAILAELVKEQAQIDSITACENFILGYRLGVRMMAKCMDENDGNMQAIIDHG